MAKLNVAQIGVGYWGPNLLRNLISNDNIDLKVVVDLSEERRDFVKKSYRSVEVSDDIDKVMKNPEIDAVVISTPVASHFELAMQALNAGLHILVEKPMATTVEEIDKIAAAASKQNLTAMVGHTFIYNSAVRYVKKLIDNRELGDIRYIYSQRVNLGRIRTDVDVLWNFAPHDISIIQYWLNNPNAESISVQGHGYIQNGINDVAFLNIKYPKGLMANVHVSWLDPHKIRRMTVVGSEKMVVYDDLAENKIAIYDKGIDIKAKLGENMDYDVQSPLQFSYRSGDVLFPEINWQEPLKVEIQHFFEVITEKIECLTGIEHAKRVVQILASVSE